MSGDPFGDAPRLKSGLWIQVQLRLCDRMAIPFVVTRRGDPDAGAILIKIDKGRDGVVVLARDYGPDGRRVWLPATGAAPVPDAEAEAYLERQIARDPDLWVVVVEDSAGRYDPNVTM